MFNTTTYYTHWLTLHDDLDGTKIVIRANDIICMQERIGNDSADQSDNTDPEHTSTIIYLDTDAEISPIIVKEDAATILSMFTTENKT